jgi:broad specificity phosphatase PhoE
MILKLVRHGQSKANTRELKTEEFGDHRIPLTELGHEQARRAGNSIGAQFLRNALCYASPFLRTRETIRSLLDGAGIPRDGNQAGPKIYEDPRLREVEHGYEDANLQQELRLIHGWFYYRQKSQLPEPQFVTGKWGVTGLRIRE